MRKTISLILLMVAVVATAFFSMTPASGSGVGLWSQTNSMAEIRYGNSLTLLSDGSGKVLVTGGGVVNTTASTELYDPAAGTWSFTTGGMATGRYHHMATLLSDGRVLVTGGISYGDNYHASAELYDPASKTWSTAGSMAMARANHTATLLSDGRVLVTGGLDADGNGLASAELYTPAADAGTWSSAGSMTTTRAYHTATLLSDGSDRVMVTGGFDGGNYHASVELYDPADGGTWSTALSMAERRAAHTATLLSTGQVLVAGGVNSVKKGRGGKISYVYLPSAELYDPSGGTWSSTESMATGRYYHTATALVLDDGSRRVLVAGGYRIDDPAAAAELYDPAEGGTWSTTSSMVEARYAHAATLLDDGKVVIAGGAVLVPGGLQNGYHTAAAAVYDPAFAPQTGTLTGNVTDAGKGSPLKGVKVTIRETGQSAKTDSSGNYTINDVWVGDIKVVATKRSYETQSKSATITEVGTEVNFALVR